MACLHAGNTATVPRPASESARGAEAAGTLRLRLRLRGGGGGGGKTRIQGGSRKGQWLGLKRSPDGGRVILEPSLDKRPIPTPEEEAAAAAATAAEHAGLLANHRAAGLIATQALKLLVAEVQPGLNASHLCARGDELVAGLLRERYPDRAHRLPNASSPVAERAKEYSTTHRDTDRKRVRAADMEPADLGLGAAHPTTLALNNQCGRSAPLPRSPQDRQLKLGDLAKIEV